MFLTARIESWRRQDIVFRIGFQQPVKRVGHQYCEHARKDDVTQKVRPLHDAHKPNQASQHYCAGNIELTPSPREQRKCECHKPDRAVPTDEGTICVALIRNGKCGRKLHIATKFTDGSWPGSAEMIF